MVPSRNLYILKTGTTFPKIKKDLGDFEDWTIKAMASPNAPVRLLDMASGAMLPDPVDCLGAVITGSHSMVTDDLPWSLAIEKWLPSLVSRKIPVLAICFGHQLLGRSMGGKVAFRPGGIETGTVNVCLNSDASADPLFAELSSPFSVHVDHSQSVVSLPPGAVLVASSEDEPNMAFRIGKYAWGVQFHPEFNALIMRRYVLEQQEKLRCSGIDVERVLEDIRETPSSAGILERFCRLALDQVA